MSETIWIALIVSIISPAIVSGVMFFTQRANKREDWRRQDEVARHAAAAVEQLSAIAKVGEATHRIVNNQRTVMLRALAVLSRARSEDHPADTIMRKAADDAEHDLEENVNENLPNPSFGVK